MCMVVTKELTKIEDVGYNFEVLDMGIQDANYIRSAGMAYTNLTRCVTGTGNNPETACKDALSKVAQYSVNVESLEEKLLEWWGGKEKKHPTSPSLNEGGTSVVKNPIYVVCIRF